MEPENDSNLLRRYVQHGEDTAFAEVVRRHVDMVYSVARRLGAGDTHLAEDVSQQVFISLAQQARFLTGHPTLAGWLHTTARNLACKYIRSENRRRTREKEAAAMQNDHVQPEIPWDKLQPVLDEAVSSLGQNERDALLLRFFEGKTHREIGEIFSLKEEAARKRVDRALDRLRAHFTRRGMAVSSVLLAESLGANSVQAAPAGLAGSLTGTALAKAGAAPTGLAMLAKILITMSTTTKIILGAAAMIVAVATYQYLSREGQTSATAAQAANDAPKSQPAISTAKVAAPTQVAAPVAALSSPQVQPSSSASGAQPSPFAAEPAQATTVATAQEAAAMIITMKQTFTDAQAALSKTNDLTDAQEKIDELESKLNALKLKAAGTPLQQQLTPAANALNALQKALQSNDVATVLALLKKLNAGGPPIPARSAASTSAASTQN